MRVKWLFLLLSRSSHCCAWYPTLQWFRTRVSGTNTTRWSTLSWERWFKDKCLKLSGRINVLSLLSASALTVSQYSLVVRDDEPPSNHIGMMASVIPCGHTITNVTTTSCRQSNIFQSPVTVKSLQIQIANAQFECKQMKWIRKWINWPRFQPKPFLCERVINNPRSVHFCSVH